MNYYGKKSLSSFLKIILNILLILGVAAYIIMSLSNLPDIFKLLFDKVSLIIKLRKTTTYLLFLIGGFSATCIVFNLRKIVDSLLKVNPFVIQNVISLKKIAVHCFVICGTYIINFFINGLYKNFHIIDVDLLGIHTDAEFLIFFFAGCFILILSEVFKQAVEVKEENDFTV